MLSVRAVMDTVQDQTFELGTDAAAEVSVDHTQTGTRSPAARRAKKVTMKTVLRDAAQLAADQGRGLEAFMNAAYKAFLDANPEVREQLADAQVLAELQALRQAGKVGLA
jgi:hypothetical protein